MKRETIFILVIAVAIGLVASTTQAMILDSINADKTALGGEVMNMGEIGWVYTPQFDYVLTGVETKFGNDSSPPIFDPGLEIQLDIYDGPPATGGSLLRSATFNLLFWNTFYEATFSELNMISGEDYFIGFRTLTQYTAQYSMCCNFADSGDSLPCYYGTDNSGAYSIQTSNDFYLHPILRFEGVPEPATLLLFGLGGLILSRWRQFLANLGC